MSFLGSVWRSIQLSILLTLSQQLNQIQEKFTSRNFNYQMHVPSFLCFLKTLHSLSWPGVTQWALQLCQDFNLGLLGSLFNGIQPDPKGFYSQHGNNHLQLYFPLIFLISPLNQSHLWLSMCQVKTSFIWSALKFLLINFRGEHQVPRWRGRGLLLSLHSPLCFSNSSACYLFHRRDFLPCRTIRRENYTRYSVGMPFLVPGFLCFFLLKRNTVNFKSLKS